jgi:hypothetical protein
MNKNIFIAMPFHSDFDSIYEEAIKPAIFELGYEPLRVDELKGNSDIVQDIEEGIKKSILIIADLTGKNPNVFYEVGFGRAIGKSIIPISQNPTDVTFDLRQRRYITYINSQRGINKLKNDLKLWIKETLSNPEKHNHSPVVSVHGTKFDVPKRNEFWNNLCKDADNKFYLLGGSNKSWINKTDEQSDALAKSIVRIIINNGSVRIVSENIDNTILEHKHFFKKHILPKLSTKELLSKFKKHFLYGVLSHSNYQAVISDERIVLLPTMNSKQFKDESLVLELEGGHLPQFKNYLADIERLFKDKECEIIDITYDSKSKNTSKPIKSTRK